MTENQTQQAPKPDPRQEIGRLQKENGGKLRSALDFYIDADAQEVPIANGDAAGQAFAENPRMCVTFAMVDLDRRLHNAARTLMYQVLLQLERAAQKLDPVAELPAEAAERARTYREERECAILRQKIVDREARAAQANLDAEEA